VRQAVPFALLLAAFSAVAAEVRCLPGAHAHNDYLHPRPLLDAVDHGFCSVEADIHLVNGKLLVAHDADQVNQARTLERLYLDPLKEQLSKQRKGEFSLMIDIKTEAESTYAVLRETLKKYSGMLTLFRANSIETNALTVIISGNRPILTISNEPVRYAAIDGRLPDLESKPPRSLVPWISDNWGKHFTWRGEGDIPKAERARLDKLVKQAHEQGRKIRFWAIPDDRRGWAELRRAGVDLINTDNLDGLRRFLIFENTN
jgi:glycerophosphoryl diester phosphodiesterase